MILDPQQELFSELLVKLREYHYPVFDGVLPPEGTPYPFIYLGDSQQIDQATKSDIVGSVHQTIHVYCNNPSNRGILSNVLKTVKYVCRTIEETGSFGWYVKNLNQRIIPDDTTGEALMHGVIDVEFHFSCLNG